MRHAEGVGESIVLLRRFVLLIALTGCRTRVPVHEVKTLLSFVGRTTWRTQSQKAQWHTSRSVCFCQPLRLSCRYGSCMLTKAPRNGIALLLVGSSRLVYRLWPFGGHDSIDEAAAQSSADQNQIEGMEYTLLALCPSPTSNRRRVPVSGRAVKNPLQTNCHALPGNISQAGLISSSGGRRGQTDLELSGDSYCRCAFLAPNGRE